MSKFYIILFSLFWVFISWNWYTCGIKGFCKDKSVVSESKKVIERGSADTEKDIVVGFAEKKQPIEVSKKEVETKKDSAKVKKDMNVDVALNKKCSSYLKDYLKFGGDNDKEQVLKLKRFLNEVEGNNLDSNSDFDLETLQAVKKFQKKYKDDVLVGPWGISNPTGMVFKSTRAKINSLYCAGKYDF